MDLAMVDNRSCGSAPERQNSRMRGMRRSIVPTSQYAVARPLLTPMRVPTELTCESTSSSPAGATAKDKWTSMMLRWRPMVVTGSSRSVAHRLRGGAFSSRLPSWSGWLFSSDASWSMAMSIPPVVRC